MPLADASVDLALNVFAPRHPMELARVLRVGAMLAVATPAPEHLRELASLHGVRIAPRKSERLRRQFAPLFVHLGVRRIAWQIRATRAEAAAIVSMGPAAHHLTAAGRRRLASLPEPCAVTAAVDVHLFRRPNDSPRIRRCGNLREPLGGRDRPSAGMNGPATRRSPE